MSAEQLDLRAHRAVMLVFVLDGCGACEEYVPRLQREAGPLIARGFPVLVYQADDPRPEIQALMNQYNVQATPTTLLLTRPGTGPGMMRFEGAIDNGQLHQVLGVASQLAPGQHQSRSPLPQLLTAMVPPRFRR